MSLTQVEDILLKTNESLNKPKRTPKKVPKSREFLSKTGEERSTLEDEQSVIEDENKKEKKMEKKEISLEKRNTQKIEIKTIEENTVPSKTKPKSAIVGESNNVKIKQTKRSNSTPKINLLTSEDEPKPRGFLSLLNEDGIEILQKLMDEKDHQLEKMKENHSLVEDDEPEPQGFLSQLSNTQIEKLKQGDEVPETRSKAVSPERRTKSKSPESKKRSGISPDSKKNDVISPESSRKKENKGKKPVFLSAESRTQSKPQGFLEHLPDSSVSAFVPPHIPQGFLSFFNEDDKDLLEQLTEEKKIIEEALAELNAVEPYVPGAEPLPQGFLEYLPKPAIEFIPPHEPQGFLTFMPKPALEFIPNNEPAGFLTFLEVEDQKFLKNTRK